MHFHHRLRARGVALITLFALLALSPLWLEYLQPAPQAAAQSAPIQDTKYGIPNTPSTRIAQENTLPGTDDWANIGNYDINSLSAFVGAVSVDAGNPINIHVKSTGSAMSASLYRMGYYQDHGARLYATYSGIATPAQPACTRVSSTGLVSCPWSPTLTINTDPAWISGIYLLRIDSNNGYRFFVYFTVRNDSYHSDILVMEPTKTNEAYNRYGGESLYYSGNNEGRQRAYKVSFDRPYLGGAGTGGLFVHDIEMVRWLEASGYDVSYISDVDRASNPGILLNHPVFLDEGHDEYWSWEERNNVESALGQGVNMIFASANESYWRVRLEASSLGPNRIITCYKDAALDPSPDKTITFRDLGRPENSLIGTGYQSYYDDTLYNYPWVAYAPSSSWYFDCTGLQPGDAINNVVGEEWDATLNNGFTPPGLETIAQGTMQDPHGVSLLHQSTIYTATSGAKLFAAGSIHISWGLMDHSYANQVFQPAYLSNDADPRMEQMFANLIDRFAGYWNGQPRPCAGQTFYKIGPRPTRTPRPQVPTATPTGTPLTPTRTYTPTPIRTASVTATPNAGCSVTYASLDVPKAIPDQSTITSALVVNDVGTISDIKVTNLSIQHTYASDLSVYLISPQGTRTALFTNVCGSGGWTQSNTGFTIARNAQSIMGTTCPPGQGTYLPEEGNLSVFTGQPANGTWTLEVNDGGPGDVGTLWGWSLWLSYNNPCPIGTPVATNTATNTATRTNTPTFTPTFTPQPVGTNTLQPTSTRTPTFTPTPTYTKTSIPMRSPTRTRTPTRTPTFTNTPFGTPTATPFCSMTYNSADVPKPVPDQGTTTSTLTVNDVGTIAELRVTNLTLEHTYASDLSVYLISPQGTRVALFTNICGSNVWTAANTGFTVSRNGGAVMGTTCPPGQGTYLPEEGSLTPLIGQPSNGTWTLEVSDGGPYDVGTLRAWSLWIGYGGTRCPFGAVWEETATAAVPTPTDIPTPIEVSFADVPPDSAFFSYIDWMASNGYVRGYDCGNPGEPCPGTYFHPGANVTRGQLLKMAVLAVGWPWTNPKDPTFADVPHDNAFYDYIETAFANGIINGYPCGNPGEPCDSLNRPYFHPSNNITRGQLSKVIALTQGYTLPNPDVPTFADVPADHPFFGYVEAMYTNGIINGYPCGNPGEPCDAQSRPYFRPSNSATRGQVSKLVTISSGGP